MARRYAPRNSSLTVRLDFYRDKSGGPDACWPWRGSKNDWGYGTMHWKRKVRIVPRMAWIDAKGAIPDGLCVLHHCDNPACCNPAHLWLGTHADNALDKTKKGRGNQPKGEKSGTAKLTDAQVMEIRRLSVAVPRRDLALWFEISESNVHMILGGHTWRHLLQDNPQ